jgi:hypothetical protein
MTRIRLGGFTGHPPSYGRVTAHSAAVAGRPPHKVVTIDYEAEIVEEL